MRTILFVVIFRFVLCYNEKGDLGYNLNIGNAIDVFANYGDLSQVTQVVSADYEEEEIEEEQESIEVFREKNIRVFANATYTELSGDGIADLNVYLCDTFEDLLNVYFRDFKIEGTEVPWKAFMGDWVQNEIMRTFGLKYDYQNDNCCYVLVKVTKMYNEVKLDDLSNVELKDYVKRAVNDLNVDDANEVRKFMKSYGTHYIDSYMTGDFIYQVFKFKASGYIQLRKYMRNRHKYPNRMDNLRYFFSSFFLKHVGDIRVASGNKTIENWARENLRDSQYLYSKPNLLRLNYNPNLAHTLNEMLDNEALLSLVLKTSRPLFKEQERSEKYGEIVENDLKLWEVNA